MSIQDAICQACGQHIQTELIQVITDQDDSAWKALLAHQLNTVLCPHCKTRFALDTPLIYKDSQRPFIAYYMKKPEGGTHELEKQIDEMAKTVAASADVEKPVVRLTVTLADFIEKIFLWRLGYDDRLVEFAKQQLFRNTDLDKMSRLKHRLLVDFSNKEKDKLSFIIFDRETNAPCGGINVPLEEFDSLTQEFHGNPQLMQELDKLFPTCLVSVERLF